MEKCELLLLSGRLPNKNIFTIKIFDAHDVNGVILNDRKGNIGILC